VTEYLSGDAGDVTGWRRVKRGAADLAFEAIDRATGVRRRADAIARATPQRRVLVAGVYRPGSAFADGDVDALRSTRHRVDFALGPAGDLGKFENLNRLLVGAPSDFDWLVVVDDDVLLPPRFLDRFVGVCERFDFDLAQPAQTQRSHSAWRVARRRPASLARETRLVEIGPVTAFGARAVSELLPFPELRFGWGLDVHWAAVAAERGWRLGVVDATPVRHEAARVGTAYRLEDAEAEAARFLADRPYLLAERAGDVLATHRRAG
jgi:Glycosyltransferase like family 2